MPLDNPREILRVAGSIRPEVMSDVIVDFVVTLSGASLHILPVHLQTEERVRKAVEISGTYVLQYGVREDMLSPEMYLMAAKHSWQSFDLIPLKSRTPEMYLEAAIRYPGEFQYYIQNYPDNISSGKNVYSLYNALQRVTKNRDYTVGQIKDLYNEKTMIVDGVYLDSGELEKCKLQYDPERGFVCTPLKKHEQNIICKRDVKASKRQADLGKRKIK